MDDLLNKFNALPNKNFLWSMMRYTSVIYQVIHHSKLEIHTPRNSTEYYTYISDKYWAKLIYGLSLSKSNCIISDNVKKGSYINLIGHWHNIFTRNNFVSINSIKYEISYYLDLPLESNNEIEKSIHKKIINDNSIFSDIISYILHIDIINKNICKYLLKYVLISYKIDEYIIDNFYNYLISLPMDPCRETECRDDIIILLEHYL